MSRPWWQTAVFYQIYPRSFADGNGDGIGDLGGIRSRLDDLQELGIDAIWLSPHYPSPQIDWGYDVADYQDVAPKYGTLAEFRQLLDDIHQRGMYLILDLVLNHTSDQHAWFRESISSADNPKRDWYVWRKGQGDQPPNNWYSYFGGPAWQHDERSGEWYYHFFFKEQPDLNWRNPEVQEAMFNMVRFWLEMGVDGFRLDAIGTIYEDPALTDNPPGMLLSDLYHLEREAVVQEEHQLITRQRETLFQRQHTLPEVHTLMKELRKMVDAYPGKVLIGETDEIAFYGSGDDELHMVFNFPLIRMGQISPALVRANQSKRLAEIPAPGWPGNTLGNHDTPRMLSQFGKTGDPQAVARLNLALLLTLKGTPFLYNGEEIGMENAFIGDLAILRDPLAFYAYRMEREVMLVDHREALAHANLRGRDKSRTPLQWSDAPNAGFCPPDVRPWLPVDENYRAGVNFSAQRADPDSLWNFYRRMLRLRKSQPVLQIGDFTVLKQISGEVLTFLRSTGGEACFVALNYSTSPVTIQTEAIRSPWQVLFSSDGFGGGVLENQVDLNPYQIWIAGGQRPEPQVDKSES